MEFLASKWNMSVIIRSWELWTDLGSATMVNGGKKEHLSPTLSSQAYGLCGKEQPRLIKTMVKGGKQHPYFIKNDSQDEGYQSILE